jgi:hypothetical protein
MAKFRIRLKVQGLELEVDGEREDIPLIAKTIQQQFAGMLEPINVAAEVPKQLPSRTESAGDDGAGKSRSFRRRGGGRSSGEPEAPIDFRHDAAKLGNPVQTWSVTEKCVWLLYVLKQSAGVNEVSAGQLVATFNQQFKAVGKLHPPNVARELARAKAQNPPAVGQDKSFWFVTPEGERQAGELIKSVTTPTLV